MVKNFAQEIREASILGALAFGAIHGLRSDDISENDAYKKYGKAWVRHNVDLGHLHFARIGSTTKSTKMYSVFEIETLKRAEKRIEEMYQVILKNQEHV